MSPEHQQPNSENTSLEIAFVQQALAAADRSERSSRIIVACSPFPPSSPSSGCTFTCFRRRPWGTPAFTPSRRPLFLVLQLAITMYLR